MTREAAAVLALGLSGAIITCAFVAACVLSGWALGWAIAAFITAAVTVSRLSSIAFARPSTETENGDSTTNA